MNISLSFVGAKWL